jgi:hypothetical protein
MAIKRSHLGPCREKSCKVVSTDAAVVGFGSGGAQKFGGSSSDEPNGVEVSGTTDFD